MRQCLELGELVGCRAIIRGIAEFAVAICHRRRFRIPKLQDCSNQADGVRLDSVHPALRCVEILAPSNPDYSEVFSVRQHSHACARNSRGRILPCGAQGRLNQVNPARPCNEAGSGSPFCAQSTERRVPALSPCCELYSSIPASREVSTRNA